MEQCFKVIGFSLEVGASTRPLGRDNSETRSFVCINEHPSRRKNDKAEEIVPGLSSEVTTQA